MTTTSLVTLADRARRLTQANSDPAQTPRQPLAIAAQDPFVEPLVEALAGRLPLVLANSLRATKRIDDVDGALAAAAVCELLTEEPAVLEVFQKQLALPGLSPRKVALAAARAYGARHCPPLRTRKWHLLDVAGLGLQLVTAAAIWIGRGLLFCYLTQISGCLRPGWTWHDALLFSTGLMLSADKLTATKWSWALFAFVAIWLALEGLWAPPLLEAVRRLPAMCEGEPPPISWRADSFSWAWRLLAVVISGSHCISAVAKIIQQISATY